MKVVIFYRPKTEQARAVEEFIHEFQRRYPESELTVMDVDTVQGGQEAEIYDVVQYPTVIARTNEGSTLQRWDNGMMPLLNEVAYYTNQ